MRKNKFNSIMVRKVYEDKKLEEQNELREYMQEKNIQAIASDRGKYFTTILLNIMKMLSVLFIGSIIVILIACLIKDNIRIQFRDIIIDFSYSVIRLLNNLMKT